MGLFDKVGSLFGGGQDLSNLSGLAFAKEQERLRKLRKKSTEETAFLATEGEGIAEKADIKLGDQLDLEDLTEEERRQRSTGRITPNTGLIL